MTLKIDLENILGRTDTTNFSTGLMRIVFKADPVNTAKLRHVYPNLVETVKHFKITGEELDLPYDN